MLTKLNGKLKYIGVHFTLFDVSFHPFFTEYSNFKFSYRKTYCNKKYVILNTESNHRVECIITEMKSFLTEIIVLIL